ncbi:MAG: DUF465 domain-containing protein [Deferribacterota bacterium]|nr:DUF465 domain-containing protein [Deferribacterota bacterium]
MVEKEGEIVEILRDKDDEFKKLYLEHIRLEQDLEALYSLKYFPPEVEKKIKEIKVLKLRYKDRMRQIISNYKNSYN